MSDQVPPATLYRLVPATEEDLLEELAEEQRRPHEQLVGCELYWPRGPHAVREPEAPASEDHMTGSQFDEPTSAQALGLVLNLMRVGTARPFGQPRHRRQRRPDHPAVRDHFGQSPGCQVTPPPAVTVTDAL